MKTIYNFLLFVVAVGISPSIAQELGPADHFKRGKELMAAHCRECYGKTKEGLEQAIAELKLALNSGHENKKEAYLLLANGLNDYAYSYYGKLGQPEEGKKEELLEERRNIFRTLYQLYPEDPEILDLYVREAVDRKNLDESLKVYRKLNELRPQNTNWKMTLASLLIQTGSREEGMKLLKEGLERLAREYSEIEYAWRFLERFEGLVPYLAHIDCPLIHGERWIADLNKAKWEFSKAVKAKDEKAKQRAQRDFKPLRDRVVEAMRQVECKP
jgi:tetratricopeptide (TPR) repeat protein